MMASNMTAPADSPIHAFIADRYSPYVFDSRPIARDDLQSLFEAARWAPSSFNEQPWRYIVAEQRNATEFARLLSCLTEGNQPWARVAPVLALGIARRTLTRNEKPNRLALHDLGLATANLTTEAMARGIRVHQMGGILPDRAQELYAIPEVFEPVTGIAIGYPGDPQSASEALRERETTPRRRRPMGETVFGSVWEQPAFES